MSVLVPASTQTGAGNGMEAAREESGEAPGPNGFGVPVNFTGEAWAHLESVSFMAKINGPWGNSDGQTGVGVDSLAYEAVTCGG